MSQPTIPSVLERHELKYLISREQADAISRFVAPYCDLDEHSQSTEDQFYEVNSLYFDTRDCVFLKQRLWGADSRFNMRARAYEADGAAAVYLEIKHRRATCGVKYRASIAMDAWPGVITTPELFPAEPGSNLALFQRLAVSYAIEPKVFTQYRRRAFISNVDDYARLTMDRAMRVRPQTPLISDEPYSLLPDGNLVNYDNESIYSPGYEHHAGVVLELKSTIGFIPSWMVRLIQHFELTQVGFSKYVNSSLVSHVDNGYHFMPNDRLESYPAAHAERWC